MSGPLAGIRVLDMALLLPGALAATWLGDLGATVTRVEPPWGGGVMGWRSEGPDPYFSLLRSGKRLRQLNLRDAEARAALLALVDEADVLIEGFRPGTLARRGLDLERLRARNPRLIVCSLSSFGQSGARRDEPGHDANFLALAGLLALNRGESGTPHLLPFQVADVGGGTYPAMVAILAALLSRERSGAGQILDVSLFDGTLAWGYFALPLSQRAERHDEGMGMALLTGGALCYNIYECADGLSVALAALEPHFWRNVCELLERPDLLPFAANPEPGAAARLAELRALFRSRPRAAWLALLGQKETLASPLLTLDEVLADPFARSRAVLSEEEGLPRIRFPVKVT